MNVVGAKDGTYEVMLFGLLETEELRPVSGLPSGLIASVKG
jgi:hypothetical protein